MRRARLRLVGSIVVSLSVVFSASTGTAGTIEECVDTGWPPPPETEIEDICTPILLQAQHRYYDAVEILPAFSVPLPDGIDIVVPVGPPSVDSTGVAGSAPAGHACWLGIQARPSYNKPANSNIIAEDGVGWAYSSGVDPSTGWGFQCTPSDVSSLTITSYLQHYCQRPLPWNIASFLVDPPPQPTYQTSATGNRYVQNNHSVAKAHPQQNVPLMTQGSDPLNRDGVDCGPGSFIRVLYKASMSVSWGGGVSCDWNWIAYYGEEFRPDSPQPIGVATTCVSQ